MCLFLPCIMGSIFNVNELNKHIICICLQVAGIHLNENFVTAINLDETLLATVRYL